MGRREEQERAVRKTEDNKLRRSITRGRRFRSKTAPLLPLALPEALLASSTLPSTLYQV